MKKKEYDAYSNLLGLVHQFRNVHLRESKGPELDELDSMLEYFDRVECGDFEKKAKELKKDGITPETKILFKKGSVASFSKLPSKQKIGTCFFAEQEARYYVRGKSKWMALNWLFMSAAQANRNKIPAELYEPL